MTTWVLRICAIVFAATMFFASWNGAVRNREFAASGETAIVEPIDHYTETTTTKTKFGIEVGQTKDHSAELSFALRDGQRITVSKRLPDEILERFANGQPVQIEYLPASPTTTRFAGESSSPVLVALFGILTAVATYYFWKRM